MLLPGGGQTKGKNKFEEIHDHQGPLPPDPPNLVYARFMFDKQGNHFIFRLEKCGLVPGDDLDSLCHKRRGSNPANDIQVGHVGADPLPACQAIAIGPTDIPINGVTRVVVELAPGIAWQFRTAGPAITQKDAYVGPHQVPSNQDLKHVNPTPGNGNTAGNPLENGCRLAFFDVVARNGCDRQSFNLHVELIQDEASGATIETVFDPDVPDVGGSFPLVNPPS